MGSGRQLARCALCEDASLFGCAGCGQPWCELHRRRSGACELCEPWLATEAMRHASKLMFSAPVMILVGGLVFGTVAPVLGGLVGAIAVSAVTAAVSCAAGAVVCRLVDGSARHLLDRHHRRALPSARVLRERSANATP